MKKLLLFLICFIHLWSFSQNESFSQKERYTVLYLIPFFSELSDEISISQIKNDYDIYTYSSFQLISFWEGAQIALREFEKQSVKLDIIVKDIVPDDIEKMKLVLDDTALMSRVDLIIGPFYKNVFEIAAQYALTYRIPIVNPLSNNNDYLNVNPFVYKAIPGKNTKPFWIEKKLLSQYDHAKVILYYDNENMEIPHSLFILDLHNDALLSCKEMTVTLWAALIRGTGVSIDKVAEELVQWAKGWGCKYLKASTASSPSVATKDMILSSSDKSSL